LPALDVIRSATLVNAEPSNRSDELGVIAPGAPAHDVVVDSDPLGDITLLEAQGNFLPLIIEGGRVYRNTLYG